MTLQIQKIYRLAEFELDPNKRLLKRDDGRVVHLSHLPFRVLLYFVENRERIVSRQELLDQFWEGRDVYDITLTKCVGAIRKALGEDSEKAALHRNSVVRRLSLHRAVCGGHS